MRVLAQVNCNINKEIWYSSNSVKLIPLIFIK